MKDPHVSVEAGGVTVTVTGAGLLAALQAATESLTEAKVASRIATKDATVWGSEAEREASIRLGWLDLPRTSRQYLGELAALHAQFESAGLDHVVLAGMGGSSLAPEVIAATAGVRLTVLDTTDAGQVASAIADHLERTILVVSSKSGGTLETDSHRRAYERAFRDAGIDPRERIVVVTDPGSPLEASARAAEYRVFLADPNVGGRYSALSAFGLVPSALAGVDVGGLLDDAAALLPTLANDSDNPALSLGAVLGEAGRAGRDKVVIADFGSRHPGFGDWAEQLVAESTGKQGTGLLPVVVESVEAPGFSEAPDRHLVVLGAHLNIEGTTVSGSLGAQFLAWEYATAVAGHVLGIDPLRPAERAGVQGQHPADPRRGRRRSATRRPAGVHRRGNPGFHRRSDPAWRRTPGRRRIAGAAGRGARPWLSRRDGLPRPACRFRRGAGAKVVGSSHRAPGHVRVGSAFPALDRAVPQGRPSDGCVPADHRSRRT